MLEWLSPLATLLASFFGAWFAFRLQNSARSSEILKAQVETANKVIFSLAQMLTSLKIFQLDYIDPNRTNPGIAYSMPPLFDEISRDIQIDYSGLSHLLTTEHSAVVMDLFIQQQRYEEAIRLINYRSQLHMDSVQPALEKAGFDPDTKYTLGQFRNALGIVVSTRVEQATSHVVHQVDKTINTLEEAKSRLLKALATIHPKEQFIDFVIDPSLEKPTEASSNK